MSGAEVEDSFEVICRGVVVGWLWRREGVCIGVCIGVCAREARWLAGSNGWLLSNGPTKTRDAM